MTDAIDAFARHLEQGRRLSAHTVRAYGEDVRQFLAFLQQQASPPRAWREVTHREVRRFLAGLQAARYARRSTARKLAALRAFFRFLVATGAAEGNPAVGIHSPRRERRLPAILREDEIERLLLAPDRDTPLGLRDAALLETLYSTGMRVAELCALDRSQVREDLLGQAPVYELPIVGKGRRPRVVFLDALAQALLRQYLETRDDDFPALFRPYRGRATEEGRLTPRMIQAALARYARQAGLATTPTPHTLRHTFAVHKLQAGADVRIVQAFLGHASLSTTQRYTRVTDRYLREAYLEAHRPLALAAPTPEST